MRRRHDILMYRAISGNWYHSNDWYEYDNDILGNALSPNIALASSIYIGLI